MSDINYLLPVTLSSLTAYTEVLRSCKVSFINAKCHLVRLFITPLSTIILFFITASCQGLFGQTSGGTVGRFGIDPIAGPQIELSYLNRFGQQREIPCGGRLTTSSFLNTASDGELPVYEITIKNTGGIFLSVSSDDIQLSGSEFTLLRPVNRPGNEYSFGPEDEIVPKIVHDNRCFNLYFTTLNISIQGVSRTPCQLSITESMPRGVTEEALLSLGEPIDSPCLDQYDGVYDLSPEQGYKQVFIRGRG